MARKVVSRKQLREEADAAERSGVKKKVAKKKAVKKVTKRKAAKKKVVKEVRLKAFWGVFTQSLQRVAIFEYSQRDKADAKAEALSTSQKTPHFVKLVKEVIEE